MTTQAAPLPRSPPIGGWVLVGLAALALLSVQLGLLGYAAAQGFWLVDPAGRPVARDFGCFWAAGRLVLAGRGADAYRWSAMQAVLAQTGSKAFAGTAFPFLYPPFYLLLMAPLGAMPYLAAGLVWVGGAALAYLAAARAIVRRPAALLAAAAAPSAMFSIWIGHNGLLSAALLGGGLALLPRRPVLAGVLLGALACKPQFAVLLPFALAAGGRWRGLAAAAATVVVLAAAGGAAFGWSSYAAFLHALAPGGGRLGVLGVLPAAKLQSVYGLMLFAGAAPALARAVQVAVALGAAALVAALWRSARPYPLKAAGLISAVLLASPYSNIYDLPLTVMAVLFLARDDAGPPPGPAGRTALIAAYLLPFLFMAAPCPVGPAVCGLLAGVVAARCVRPSP